MNIIIANLVQNNRGYLTPTFWGYGDSAKRYNKSVISAPLSDIYNYNVTEIDKISKSCELMIICNPNNPTTATLTKNQIENLLLNNPQTYFLIDESMLPYKYDFFNYTMIPFVEKYTNLIVCSSISKSLCAPGLRIGYICANEKIVKKLEKKVIPFNVSNINQCIAEKILENFPLSLSICSDIESSFRQLDLFMEKYTTQKSEKACGFRLYQLKAKYDGNKIIDILTERGFLIRNISASYPELGENWIRISNGTLSEIKDLMHIMKDIFEDFDDKASDSYDKG